MVILTSSLMLDQILITIQYTSNLPLVRKSWGLHKLSYMAIKDWNALEKGLRDVKCEVTFKSSLSNILCKC